MSQDYPDRSVWLAKRYTPRVVRAERPLYNGGTLNIGSRKRKTKTWNRKRRERAAKRLLKKAVGR